LTSFGSALTQMATSIGYALPEGAVDITGLSAGNWVSWVVYQIGRINATSPLLSTLLMLVVLGLALGLAARFAGIGRKRPEAAVQH
jgi:hypothetical protein